MQRKSGKGGSELQEPTELWRPRPFVVKMEEDTFSDGTSKANQMHQPQPWLVEPSLGRGECLVGYRRSRIAIFSSCLSCKNWGLPSSWHVLKAKGSQTNVGIKRE